MTGPYGRFAAELPSGPSRKVRVAYWWSGNGVAERRFDLRVRARPRAEAPPGPRRPQRPQGPLQGPAPGARRPRRWVRIQARSGKRWMEVSNGRTNLHGAYRAHYRFHSTAGRQPLRLPSGRPEPARLPVPGRTLGDATSRWSVNATEPGLMRRPRYSASAFAQGEGLTLTQEHAGADCMSNIRFAGVRSLRPLSPTAQTNRCAAAGRPSRSPPRRKRRRRRRSGQGRPRDVPPLSGETRDDDRVGVHDHHDVAVVDAREHLRQCLVQRARLLVAVANRREDLRRPRRATSAVSSVQLSATTTTLSGGRACPHNDSRSAPIVRVSLWAGTSTVRRNGVCESVRACGPGACWAGSSGSLTSRIAEGPNGVSTRPRNRRISGDNGAGTRRSRASTRIAAAACSEARADEELAIAARGGQDRA